MYHFSAGGTKCGKSGVRPAKVTFVLKSRQVVREQLHYYDHLLAPDTLGHSRIKQKVPYGLYALKDSGGGILPAVVGHRLE